jgi:hypothetical protein
MTFAWNLNKPAVVLQEQVFYLADVYAANTVIPWQYQAIQFVRGIRQMEVSRNWLFQIQ